jgi:hypothetical protein
MRGHPFEHVKTTVQSTDWEELKRVLQGQIRISVSGGGDPLYQLEQNMDWWEHFFDVAQGLEIDLHTAKLSPVSFARNFAKYVWHVKDITKPIALEYKQLVDYGIPVRMVAVGEERYTEDDYLRFARQVVMMGFQCSFRELVVDGEAKNIALTSFLETERWWKFVRQADYNTYFMPDNNLYDKFLIGETSHA